MKLLAAILAVWLLLATPSAARAQTSQPLHRITGKREVMPGHKSASRRSPRSPFLDHADHDGWAELLVYTNEARRRRSGWNFKLIWGWFRRKQSCGTGQVPSN
jgi:hypothetical protein